MTSAICPCHVSGANLSACSQASASTRPWLARTQSKPLGSARRRAGQLPSSSRSTQHAALTSLMLLPARHPPADGPRLAVFGFDGTLFRSPLHHFPLSCSLQAGAGGLHPPVVPWTPVSPAICLRACPAICLRSCYAMPATAIRCRTICLRACYAIPSGIMLVFSACAHGMWSPVLACYLPTRASTNVARTYYQGEEWFAEDTCGTAEEKMLNDKYTTVLLSGRPVQTAAVSAYARAVLRLRMMLPGGLSRAHRRDSLRQGVHAFPLFFSCFLSPVCRLGLGGGRRRCG